MGDPPDRSKAAIDQIRENSENGTVINGLLVWMDIQNHTTAPSIWKAQMVETFDDEEILEAKTTLFSVVGGEGTRIGKFENHPKKKSLHAEDLFSAMTKLWEATEAPLLLGTSTVGSIKSGQLCRKLSCPLCQLLSFISANSL